MNTAMHESSMRNHDLEKYNNNKRIARNSAFLYFRSIITMIIGFVTSRVVLQNLGVQDYGIYNVIGGVASMFIFLNTTMSVSISRFLTFELGKGNSTKLKEVYSQAKLIHYVLSIVMFILVECVGLWLIYYKLTIPEDRISIATYVLHTAAIGTVLGVIATPDTALVISHERMRFFAYISMLDSILRLLAAILISNIPGNRLIWYSVFMLLVFGIDRICYLVYCKAKFAETRGKIVYSKSVFRSMISFAGWNVIGNLANMTREQGLTIIINIFTNPVVNAARAVTTQITNSITAFVFNVRTAINPQITKAYAEGDYDYMHKLIMFSSLSCFYILLIIFIPLFFISDFLFEIWLVEVPQYTSVFFRISLIGVLIYSFSNPLIIGIHATGQIVKFQVVEGILLLTALPLAIVFFQMNYKPVWAYVAIIISNILTLFGDVLVVLPALRFSKKKYFCEVLLPALKVSLLAILLPSLGILFNNFYPVAYFSYIISFLSLISSVWIVYLFGLTRSQRSMVRHKIIKLFHR